MVQRSYSQKEIAETARRNYRHMLEFCGILEAEGYWDKPGRILEQTVYDVLDLYIQSVLIQFCVTCGCFCEVQKRFIRTLPDRNAIGLPEPETGEPERGVLITAARMAGSPPILIQLFGVRDRKEDSYLTGRFFDCLVNLFLLLAACDSRTAAAAGRFIQEYYQRFCMFLNNPEKESGVTPRYLFRKLSSDSLEEDFLRLMERRESVSPADAGRREAAKTGEDKPARMEKEPEKERRAAARTRTEPSGEQEEEEKKREERLAGLLDELNGLIGLEAVKQEVNSLVNLIKIRKLRASYQMPLTDMTYHMVFTGNPGTGKTTVARLTAGIYRELGILSKGTLTETDRAGLVAGYVGQTALKVKETVDGAVGGVLFIDEAYALTDSQASNDFGREAVDTLVKRMEDHREDLVVIAAGYTKEMREFLKSNSGLVSRFNKFIEFPDYTTNELTAILTSMADKAGVRLEPEALLFMENALKKMTAAKKKRYGNARGIRNSFEKILVRQADRLVKMEHPKPDDLKQILAVDVIDTV